MATGNNDNREILKQELEQLRFTGDIIDIVPYDDDSELLIIQPPPRYFELLVQLKDDYSDDTDDSDELFNDDITLDDNTLGGELGRHEQLYFPSELQLN